MSVSNTTKRVKEIRRKTRRKFSAEEKIRIVLEGLRGEGTLCVAKVGSTAEIVRQRLEPVTEVTGKGITTIQPVVPEFGSRALQILPGFAFRTEAVVSAIGCLSGIPYRIIEKIYNSFGESACKHNVNWPKTHIAR